MRRPTASCILLALLLAVQPLSVRADETQVVAHAASQSAQGEVVIDEEIDTAPELAPESLPPAVPRQVGALNGRFLILNMHGLLFHKDVDNIYENIDYARWMNAAVIRVFATDAGNVEEWSGVDLGKRIAAIAPALRAADMKLIVALVNNHKQVPGERPDAYGWMDGYHQLLLPFYKETWQGAYLSYVRGLIGTVVAHGASDVVWAWELGNELHTPVEPRAVMPFINGASAEVRQLDPGSRVLAGTMGVNHLEPGVKDSETARALYCHGPISAYTLHTYDWRTSDYWGDMPIHWDFEHIVNRPCPNGRRLPIIVEELGTSRALPGVYDFEQEDLRLAQEINQIRMVLQYDGVIGIGAWSAESPTVRDISRFDTRRGLTSYGPNNLGSGSCYRPTENDPPGVRCELEQLLQALPQVP